MAMPSDTAIVTNSKGNPPASRKALLRPLGEAVEREVQGVTSSHDDATPTWDRSQSQSPHPDGSKHGPCWGSLGPHVASDSEAS